MDKLKKTRQTASIATAEAPLLIDSESGLPIPTPSKRKRHIKLDSVRDIRREMAKVYRDAKHGKIPPEVGSRFVFMLATLAKITVDSEFEARIEALERTIK